MLNLSVDRVIPVMRIVRPRAANRETLVPAHIAAAETDQIKRIVPKVFVDSSRGTKFDLLA